MIGKLTFLFLGIIIISQCSESTLKGEITDFSDSSIQHKVQFIPLSEQPRLANIQNSVFEFIVISEGESCRPIDKKKLQRQKIEPPAIAIIDFTSDKQNSCGMSTRMTNIKTAGGYGLLIVTDDPFPASHCRMYDSNSFLTGLMDGQNFRKFIEGRKPQDKITGQITISLKDSKLKLLQAWTSSLNAASYDNMILLSKIFEKLPSLYEKTEWRPRIASFGCTHGQNPICTSADFVSSCACKGQFCSPQAHEKTPQILLQEDIRQLLIFRQYPSKYFQYIKLFKQKCYSKYVQQKFSTTCSTNIMDKLNIDSTTINKVISDFTYKCAVEEDLKTVSEGEPFTTLQKDQRAFANYGRYPLLLLNKQILEYNSQEDLAGQLCRKIPLQDEGCFQVNSTTVTSYTGIMFYVLLVVLLTLVGAGVVYFYRKKLKRDMNKQIKMQVSTAVQHYFALTDVK